MDTYSFLRQLADSWVLLAMTLFYLGAILWAFRPGARGVHADIAAIPLREDEPTPPEPNETAGCTGRCDTCACTVPDFLTAEIRHD